MAQIDILKATYNITDITNPTQILYNLSDITAMKIGSAAIQTASTTYQFSRTGNYTIRFYIDYNGPNFGDFGSYQLGNVFMSVKTLISVELMRGITSISNSFYSCSNLRSVTLPDSLTSIGASAFVNCTSLRNISIPDTVTSIGSYAFEGCTRLTLNIGVNVSTSNPDIFYNASNIKLTINIPTIESSWLSGDAITELTIGPSVTTLQSSALASMGNITSIVIPNNVTSIGENALGYCSALKEVTIGNGITTLPTSLLQNDTNLETLTIGSSVTTIQSYITDSSKLSSIVVRADIPPTLITPFAYTFSSFNGTIYVPTQSVEAYKTAWGYDKITTLYEDDVNPTITEEKTETYYNSVTPYLAVPVKKVITKAGNIIKYWAESKLVEGTIGSNNNAILKPHFNTSIKSHTFENGVGTIEFYSNVTRIGVNAFSGTAITKIEVPDTIVKIESGAFAGSTLQTIELSNKDLEIETGAFSSCTNLIKASIKAKSLGDLVFYSCTSLQIVELEEGLTHIGGSCFSGCINLENLHLPDSMQTTGTTIFTGCNKLTTINIPKNLKELTGGFAYGSCFTEIVIPKTVETIWNGALCTSTLTKVTLEGNTTVKGGAISGYSTLDYLYIGPTVTLETGCFSGGNDTYINNLYWYTNNFPKAASIQSFIGSTRVHNLIFGGKVELPQINGSGFCQGVLTTANDSLTLEEGIKEIPSNCFAGNSGITKLILPSSCEIIRDAAFIGIQLTELKLNEGLKFIGDVAFNNCSISEITLPNSLEVLESGVFNSSTLKKLVVRDNCRFVGNVYGTLDEIVLGKNVKTIYFGATSSKVLKLKSKYPPENIVSNSIQKYLVPKEYLENYQQLLTGKTVETY